MEGSKWMKTSEKYRIKKQDMHIGDKSE